MAVLDKVSRFQPLVIILLRLLILMVVRVVLLFQMSILVFQLILHLIKFLRSVTTGLFRCQQPRQMGFRGHGHQQSIIKLQLHIHSPHRQGNVQIMQQ